MASSSAPIRAFEKAVGIAGGQVAFARVVGCTQGNISQLLKAGRPLPARFVIKAEQGTGVSKHDLRPDLYPREAGPTPAPAPAPTPFGDMEPAR